MCDNFITGILVGIYWIFECCCTFTCAIFYHLTLSSTSPLQLQGIVCDLNYFFVLVVLFHVELFHLANLLYFVFYVTFNNTGYANIWRLLTLSFML